MSTAVTVSCERLELKLTAALTPNYVKAIDLSDGCGSKFEITVVSEYV